MLFRSRYGFPIGAADWADSGVLRGLGTGVTNGYGQRSAGAQRVKQSVGLRTVHEALMHALGVARDRQRAGFVDQVLPPGTDLVWCVLSGERCELPDPSLRYGAAAWSGVRARAQIHVAGHLAAGKSGSERLLGLPDHPRHAPAGSTYLGRHEQVWGGRLLGDAIDCWHPGPRRISPQV